jgi:hypothetical protein
MAEDSSHNELHGALPPSFFEGLVKDIPAETWLRLLHGNSTLKTAVLEGFNVPANKLKRLLHQPHMMKRLQRFIRSENAVLDDILQVWGQEQLSAVAFLEMLDRDFLLDNWLALKNFIGPGRFYAGIRVLNHLGDREFQKLIDEDFWERQIDAELLNPMVPLWNLWNGFVRQFPEAKTWLRNAGLLPGAESERGQEAEGPQALREQSRRTEERASKLQTKLDAAEAGKSQLQQEAARHRTENEELRRRLAESEKGYDQQLKEALARMRGEWFQRYQAIDREPLKEADEVLQALLQRTERAFGLQRKADEEFGLVAAVRQKLLQVELYLKEIERIYQESMVVHGEVAKAKEALLRAREKLLELPGIEKVFKQEPLLLSAADLRQQIRLLDAVPENLPKIAETQKLLSRFIDLGYIGDPQPLLADVEHKKRQIMESLYARHQMVHQQGSHGRQFGNLDDLVASGESKKYEIYLDGYNILLTLHGRDRPSSSPPLATLRDHFTDAVIRKSRHFRRVYLVFDGQEDSQERRGNTDIIYTDKRRGTTADLHLIQALRKGKSPQALLVTGDREIIQTVGDRLYAVVDPYHFYMFVYDMPYPVLS